LQQVAAMSGGMDRRESGVCVVRRRRRGRQ